MGKRLERAAYPSLTSVEDGVTVSIGVTPTRIPSFQFQGTLVDRIHTVCCRITDSSGRAGFGYAMFLSRDAARQAAQHAGGLVQGRAASLAALLAIETAGQEAGPDADQVMHSAASAISLSAWDLAGRQRNMSCAQLWGARLRPLQCYDSSILPFAPLEEIDAAVARLRASNFTRAKLAMGAADLDGEITRARKAQAALGPGNLAIDPVRRWSVEQARDVLSQLDAPLMWLEDPVVYGDLVQLDAMDNLAAGEICCTEAELHELMEAGARFLLPDVGLMGGPMRWIEAARSLEERGARVGSHAYPYYSLHLLSCLQNPLPVEVMHWGAELFVAPPTPDRDGCMTPRGPGFGLTVNEELLANSTEWFMHGG